nr:hypothetical protein [Propionibacterium australiense]
MTSIDDVVARLAEIIEAMPEDVVVPGGPPGFPPPGAAPDRLRLKLGELRKFTGALCTDQPSASTVRAWISGLVTDLVADSSGRGAISQYAAPSGKQSMATMLQKPFELVRDTSEYLREAFVGWRRVPGVTGEYLDHRANWDSSEDGRGKAEMRGVPGATWLALMSYSLWTTTASGAQPRTSGWHTVSRGRRREEELRLPLWGERLGPAAVKVLVEHPALVGDWKSIDHDALRTLGVIHVCRARRRKAEGGKSAGVLVPLS